MTAKRTDAALSSDGASQSRYWQELNDIRRERGLDPVPIDGYVPSIDRPAKMKKWYG